MTGPLALGDYETYDYFVRPEGFHLLHSITRTQTGEVYKIWPFTEPHARISNGNLQFFDGVDGSMVGEAAIDVASENHEVATVFQVINPTSWMYLVARHAPDDGYGVVVVIDHSIDVATFVFASPAEDLVFPDTPTPYTSCAYVAQVGDHVALRVITERAIDGTPITSVATFYVNGIVMMTCDLMPYPILQDPEFKRLAIASGDTTSEFSPFLAHTFPRSSGMTNFLLADVSAVVASYGRGVVFFADKWDGVTPLSMTQLGVTEGDIVVTPNAATAGLTLPELTGPAPHEMDYLGEAPTIEIPLYLADPALIAICSPSGSAHAGRSRRGAVKEHTILVIPEALFLDADSAGIVTDYTVAFDGAGAWTFNSIALSPERQAWLDAAFWLWRGVFNRPTRRFRGGAGDDSKNIETVSLISMHHPLMPEGHHIYTTGDPFEAGIDLNGMS